MTTKLSIDPAHSAVLCMDYQTGIVSNYIKDEHLLPRAVGVLQQARSSGLLIIYIQIGFRPNFPEISPRNAAFSTVRNSVERQQLFVGLAREIHAAVTPEADDIIVTKHRV